MEEAQKADFGTDKSGFTRVFALIFAAPLHTVFVLPTQPGEFERPKIRWSPIKLKPSFMHYK